MKIGLVVPHIFMHPDVLPHVIFSPGHLALDLAESLQAAGHEVTLFCPGNVRTSVPVVTADMSYFDQELAGRGDSYVDLLKKHTFIFVTLARQVQSEILAEAFARANHGELDIVHVYSNEEDMALPFAQLCTKPVVFTHHDPFNFLVKYKSVFPKYKADNWLSVSFAQRAGMPADTNWVGNTYHGIAANTFAPQLQPAGDYVAYIGRIIEPKGVHLAIAAVQAHNATFPDQKLTLKIAGKHYSDNPKDQYWQRHIVPHLDDEDVEFVGFIADDVAKQEFLGNARALMIPSTFDEPFGIVMIEALACATPIIGLDSGAISEVIMAGKTGVLVQKKFLSEDVEEQSGYDAEERGAGKNDVKKNTKQALDEAATAQALAKAIPAALVLDRAACRADFEARFTSVQMVESHMAAYRQLVQK